MPMYTWQCQDCEKTVEVSRPMSEYEKGPEDPCECGKKEFKRIIAEWKREQTVLVPGGKAPWFSETMIGRFNNGR